MTNACIAVLMTSLLAAPGSPRFSSVEARPGPAEWVSAYEGRVAFGSGTSVTILSPNGELERTLELDRAADRAVLADTRLYVVGNRRLGIVDLAAGVAVTTDAPTTSRSEGRLFAERMGDFLVVAEDGVGVRILTLPPPARHAAHGGHHEHAAALEETGRLRIDGGIDAIAISVRTVYLAMRGEGIAIIDATNVRAPRLERVVPLSIAPHALAANGASLYALAADGLRVIDVSSEMPTAAGPFGLNGRALRVAGRRIDVAAGKNGLLGFLDRTPQPVAAAVGVGNFVFTPAGISIQAGDTVTWQNNGGFHNVESCDGASGAGGNDPDPPGCGGAVAVEGFFTNGTASALAWSYDKQFNLVGDNKYFCEIHATSGMFGTVSVSGQLPPAVPDGISGTPLLVSKLDSGATQLRVLFDTVTCSGNTDHQLIYGFGSQLPATPGGTYGLAGAECAIGGSPFTWNGVPDPAVDASDLLWFLALATDGGTTEGSWGRDSAANQRGSSLAGGVSGQCSMAAKELSNSCGQ